jgi:hypothetical protein
MKIDGIPRLHPPVSADSRNRSNDQALTLRAKISRKQSIAETESSSAANGLQRSRQKAPRARSDRSRKGLSRRSRAAKAGWTPERRARQAALIRSWAPWGRSTGPKTEAGKTRCAMNALKHGHRSQATIREYQRIRYVLRLAARNIERLRLFIRLRDARPRIKYKFAPIRERIRKPRSPIPPVSAPTPWDYNSPNTLRARL